MFPVRDFKKESGYIFQVLNKNQESQIVKIEALPKTKKPPVTRMAFYL
jgi:hypothetical protein